MLLNSCLTACHLKISKWEREMLVESKLLLIRMPASGEMVDLVFPIIISEDSTGPWRFIKGKRQLISANHWDGRQRHHHPPQCAGLSTPYCLSSDAILFTQFVPKITEGEAGEETWSSVKHLFFSSTSLIYRKNQQDKQGIVCSKDLKGVLGPELNKAWGPWFNISEKQKGFCRELLIRIFIYLFSIKSIFLLYVQKNIFYLCHWKIKDKCTTESHPEIYPKRRDFCKIHLDKEFSEVPLKSNSWP